MFVLSSSWFVSVQRTGCRYNMLILSAYACLSIMLETINIGILMITYIIWTIINYALLKINYEKQIIESGRRYLVISSCIMVLGILSGIYIFKGAEHYNYTDVATLLTDKVINLPIFLAIMGVFMPILYAVNIAPFHIMAEEK